MSEARTFFDKIARRYDRSYALPRDASRDRGAALLALLGERRRILDLGVGTGRELRELQAAGHDVVGLDISPTMIALCNQRARPIPIVEADLWGAWPFSTASFDAVLALHGTLAHPPAATALDHVFAEAARVLRPRGTFVAELPTPAWIERARSDARIRDVAQDGDATTARFVDDANGAAITIRLYPLERWRRAAAAFELEVVPIDDGEVRLVARAVG
jgi:SAM-dependent methyltransferase